MLLPLDLMDLDLCLLEDKLIVPTDNNIPNIKAKLRKWEGSNRLILDYQKVNCDTIRGSWATCDTLGISRYHPTEV